MPKVLIVNDDGINAPGVRALAEAFVADGWEVAVVAPDSQRSAGSMCLSIRGDLRLEKAEGWGRVRAYALGGMPADCTKVGLEFVMPDADLVASGVNDGANLGADICYSGTVGAAMTAAIAGKPAISASISSRQMENLRDAAARCARAGAWLLKKPLPAGCVLNMNVPDLPDGAIKGAKWCDLASGSYYDFILQKIAGDDEEMTLRYTLMPKTKHAPGSDAEAVDEGYVAFTPLFWKKQLEINPDALLPE